VPGGLESETDGERARVVTSLELETTAEAELAVRVDAGELDAERRQLDRPSLGGLCVRGLHGGERREAGGEQRSA
jgi:hypothetical protein